MARRYGIQDVWKATPDVLDTPSHSVRPRGDSTMGEVGKDVPLSEAADGIFTIGRRISSIFEFRQNTHSSQSEAEEEMMSPSENALLYDALPEPSRSGVESAPGGFVFSDHEIPLRQRRKSSRQAWLRPKPSIEARDVPEHPRTGKQRSSRLVHFTRNPKRETRAPVRESPVRRFRRISGFDDRHTGFKRKRSEEEDDGDNEASQRKKPFFAIAETELKTWAKETECEIQDVLTRVQNSFERDRQMKTPICTPLPVLAKAPSPPVDTTRRVDLTTLAVLEGNGPAFVDLLPEAMKELRASYQVRSMELSTELGETKYSGEKGHFATPVDSVKGSRRRTKAQQRQQADVEHPRADYDGMNMDDINERDYFNDFDGFHVV